MALPNKKEKLLLDTFRARVSGLLREDQLADDMFLLRWLRARNLDLDNAEQMLINAIKWRKENGLDEVITKPKDPYFLENFPVLIDGLDKEGRPVVTSHFGKWDARKIIKSGKSEELKAYITSGFEELMRAINKSSLKFPPSPDSPPITQFRLIVDWEGFSWNQVFSYQCVQNLLQIASVYEMYYPEVLYTCYFINCPSLISIAKNLMSSVLASKTMEKITCFGSDRGVWKEAVLEVVDEDQLRPRFGGTKNDDFNPFLD